MSDDTISVTLELRLPPELAVQAEEVHCADPAFLDRVVRYALQRRAIYLQMRRNDESMIEEALRAAGLGEGEDGKT